MFRRSTTIFLVLCIWGTEATFEMVEEEAESSSPFYLLNPQDYAPIMGGRCACLFYSFITFVRKRLFL